MGFATSCIKYTMFIFNLIFLLIGLLFVGFATYGIIKIEEIAKTIGEHGKYLQAGPITLLVIGIIIVVISFLGCCGAIKESVCMLISYGVILIIIFLLHIIIATLVYVAFKNVNSAWEKSVDDSLSESIRKYWTSPEDSYDRNIVDYVQSDFKCCGVTSREDWTRIPKSCCDAVDASGEECLSDRVYNRGCHAELVKVIKDSGKILAIVLYSIAAFELISAFAAFFLTNSVRNEYRRGRY